MNKNVRGYIFSRPFMGERVPQHVQNLVIRDFCERNGLHYLLSASEYAMDNCHLILKQVLDEMPRLEGVVAYSLFQLPESMMERQKVYSRVLALSRTMYFAVEDFKLSSEKDRDQIEVLWRIRQTLPLCAQIYVPSRQNDD